MTFLILTIYDKFFVFFILKEISSSEQLKPFDVCQAMLKEQPKSPGVDLLLFDKENNKKQVKCRNSTLLETIITVHYLRMISSCYKILLLKVIQ